MPTSKKPETYPVKYAGVLIETDVLAAHLLAGGAAPSRLRELLSTNICYTSFIQTSELLTIPKTEEEERCIMDVLSCVRPLGAHPRYSKTMAKMLHLLSDIPADIRFRCALTAAIATESRIPIITSRYESIYSRFNFGAIIQ